MHFELETMDYPDKGSLMTFNYYKDPLEALETCRAFTEGQKDLFLELNIVLEVAESFLPDGSFMLEMVTEWEEYSLEGFWVQTTPLN